MSGPSVENPVRLYSYIVVHDTGFAPNPFFGYCTLACCKPTIRRTAQVGDWIVGLSPKAAGHRIVYFMRVDEKLTFQQYWSDPRFRRKRPRHGGAFVQKRGDNIYEPLPDGEYRQLPSLHAEKDKAHDLGGQYVLVSATFGYFGSRAVRLPAELNSLVVQGGHKCRFSNEVITAFLHYTGRLGRGVLGCPTHWKQQDSSWEQGC